MGAGIECWECGKLVPDDELAEGDDGRFLCCCCRLTELEEELAEKDLVGRSPDQDRIATELVSGVNVSAPRDLPPPEPDSGSWTSAY
ncbi:MAG: hypothetical protein ABSD48_20370 [Armatimonadota bacterium]|jgi:hypothetical protein